MHSARRYFSILLAGVLCGCADTDGPADTTPVNVTGLWGLTVTLTNNVMRCTIGESRIRLQQTRTTVTGASEGSQGSVSCMATSGSLPPGTTTPGSSIMGDVSGTNEGNRVRVTISGWFDDVWTFDGTATATRITGTATLSETGRTMSGEFVAQRR